LNFLFVRAINFAKQKATDISDNGIALTVFALDLPGIRFDQSKFWDDIIVGSDEDDNRVAPLGDWEDLTTAIQRKDHARRAMANLTLTLGEGLDLSVSVFTLVRTATKAPSVKLYSKTNEQVSFCCKCGDFFRFRMKIINLKKYTNSLENLLEAQQSCL
jgi:hypothetical protein